MRRKLTARAGLASSAALLAAACFVLAWKLWQGGGKEGEAAWNQGRVVALSLKTGEAESGKARKAPAVPPHAEKTPAESGPEPSEPPPPPAAAEGGLSPAPDARLSEKTAEGLLPVVAADGTKAWQAYARPSEEAKTPAIAIVLGGLGQSRSLSEAAAALPPDISLSLSPYARDAGLWAESLRARGHEVLIDLAVEQEGFPADDPGPLALLSANAEEVNAQRLRQALTKAPGAIGLLAPMDEALSRRREDAVLPALVQLNRRGLMLVSAQPGASGMESLASRAALPFLRADIAFDPSAESAAIQAQFEALEALAQRRGHALAAGRATPLLLREIARWNEGLSARGFRLVPVSALARRRFS